MSWNMASEAISVIVLCIIWIYSRKGNPIPTLKNRLFQISFLVTFIGMTTNILSAVLIDNLSQSTLISAWIITIVYYITTPIMGMVYFFYSLATIYEYNPNIKKYIFIGSFPGIIYSIIAILNIVTRDLFDISLSKGYTQGPIIALTYIIFYIYCALCLLLVMFKGKHLELSVRIILFSFPIIAALVIIIQSLIPNLVLSGSAATCSLLLIYLYIQNKQISIDYLTKIPNRMEFLKMMQLYIDKNMAFSIIVVSMKDFRNVNETRGHYNGDALLFKVSDFLKKQLHLKENELFRYSGDEFAIFLTSANMRRSKEIINIITKRMTSPWITPSCTTMLSVAIGIVNHPEISEKIDELISGIEYSVHLAKTDSSIHNICYCTPILLEKAKRNQIIKDILEDCIKNDGFEIYYQPIYDVTSKTFTLAEALLRIPNSSIGFISPGDFIPIAESTGLITEITYIVLHKVCKHIKQLMDDGIDIEGVNVNFSALQFNQRDLIEKISKIIGDYSIPFSKIKVEITESTLAENPKKIISTINQMHAMGICIGLDDFGTGYSNLTSVVNMPIDTVKLDKSLVWSSMNSSRFASLTRNLTKAFIELGINVLAEGVESSQQSNFVIECGCVYIQGFLYAKPMPFSKFEQFLTENKLEQNNNTDN